MNMNSAARRPYDLSLRGRQAKLTRDLIVKAAADLVTQEGLQALSVAEVARRAGVSLRTVWRNFPSLDALMDAVDKTLASGGPVVAGIDDLKAYVGRLYEFCEENQASVLATLYWRFSRGQAPPARAERLSQSLSILARSLGDAGPEVIRNVEIAYTLLANGMAWAILRKELGLNTQESAEGVGWIMDLIGQELKRLRGSREP